MNEKKVKVFSGVYSVIGLNGKPNLSIFTYTKSPQELNEIIPNWAAVRQNDGQPDLLRLEGDNAAGDSAQQHSAHPSLLRGVAPYHKPTDLLRFVVTQEDFIYIITRDGLDRYVLAIIPHAGKMIRETGIFQIGSDI